MDSNNRTSLLNEMFEFRDKVGMQDDCILNLIEEFAIHKDMTPELICLELSDDQAFQDIVEKNITKFGYVRKPKTDEVSLDDW